MVHLQTVREMMIIPPVKIKSVSKLIGLWSKKYRGEEAISQTNRKNAELWLLCYARKRPGDGCIRIDVWFLDRTPTASVEHRGTRTLPGGLLL